MSDVVVYHGGTDIIEKPICKYLIFDGTEKI